MFYSHCLQNNIGILEYTVLLERLFIVTELERDHSAFCSCLVLMLKEDKKRKGNVNLFNFNQCCNKMRLRLVGYLHYDCSLFIEC